MTVQSSARGRSSTTTTEYSRAVSIVLRPHHHSMYVLCQMQFYTTAVSAGYKLEYRYSGVFQSFCRTGSQSDLRLPRTATQAKDKTFNQNLRDTSTCQFAFSSIHQIRATMKTTIAAFGLAACLAYSADAASTVMTIGTLFHAHEETL